MFEKMNIMSLVDVVQLIGRARGLIGGFFGQEDHKENPVVFSSLIHESYIPTNILSAKLTKIDESYFENLTMVYLKSTERDIINQCITEMEVRDRKDSGNRVDSFRIGVLIMPNKLAEALVSQQTPQTSRRRDKKKSVKLEEESTQIKTSDPRFTDDDSRIKYLKAFAKNIEEQTLNGATITTAITVEIDRLEKSKFIATGDLLQEIQVKAEAIKNRTGYTIQSFILRVFLPSTVNEAILVSYPEPAESADPETKKKWQDAVVDELDTQLQRQNLHRSQNPPKVQYSKRYWWIIGGMTLTSVLGIVLINLINILR